MQVTIADGGKLSSDKIVQNFIWFVQRHTFSTNARVLKIGCYDTILGMEWLEDHSPMRVHWKRKKMRFTHKGTRITIRGVKGVTKYCTKISAKNLQGLIKNGGLAQLVQLCPMNDDTSSDPVPSPIQELIQQNENLFQEPKGLPPARTLDHSIPLLPGAKPVNIRPYRYAPKEKYEIEKQVKEKL